MRSEKREGRRQKTEGRRALGRAPLFCLLSSAFCLLSAAGCQSAHVGRALNPNLAGNDPGQQLEFWHELTTEPVASNDQAFHGVLLYLDGKDDGADYPARLQTLK